MEPTQKPLTLREWRQSGYSFPALSASQLKQLQKLSSGAAETIRSYNAAFADIGKTVATMVESIRPLAQSLAQVARRFSELSVPPEVFTRFAEYLEGLPARIQEQAVELAAHGWFFWPEDPHDFPAQIVVMYRAKPVQAETLLIEYYAPQTKKLFSRLRAQFPNRAHIFCEIEHAYEASMFYSVITLSLAQADGIAHEMTGRSAFNLEKGRPSFASALPEQVEGKWANAFYAGLTNKNLWSRGGRPNRLSRHTVLHGTCLDFGTRTNALKVLTYLGTLAWLHERTQLVSG